MGNTNVSGPKSFVREFLGVSALLIAALGVFFYHGLDPKLILFSSDGPLGAISTESLALPGGFFGIWNNVNWIGYELPRTTPSVAQVLSLMFPNYVLWLKYYPPLALLLFGLSAWFLCRQLRFHPAVGVIVGLAAALNTDPFSYACWGLGSLVLCLMTFFLALAVLVSPRPWSSWQRCLLAGFAVGMGLMEGYDNGAILSLIIGSFVLFQSAQDGLNLGRNLAVGAGRGLLVALAAAWIAAATLSTLVGTQIQGVAKSDPAASTKDWDFATQWSLPKLETLRVLVPGLFGYRMDTAAGGNYWGTVGRQPGWEEHHQGYPRHSGAGFYPGAVVLLVALCAIANALRGEKSPFPATHRRFILFWLVVAVIGLLFSWGRHAPFYRLFYALPGMSAIRNPVKFMHIFNLAILILFGCGLNYLFSRLPEALAAKAKSFPEFFQIWWKNAKPFDRRLLAGCVMTLGLALVGWLVFATSGREIENYLRSNAVAGTPSDILHFANKEIGWFVLFWTCSILLAGALLSGWFAGPRRKWATLLLGALIVTDFSHANTPWVVYYDYQKKYASNPVIEFLRKATPEYRVTHTVFPFGGASLVGEQLQNVFGGVCGEWLQHHFQYYNIQSLNIVQMPRVPALDDTFRINFLPASNTNLSSCVRLWQLTNTRYVLGQKEYLGALNQQFDPAGRFRIHSTFNIVPKKPNGPIEGVEDLTAEFSPSGAFAIFEVPAVLPRYKLFSQWTHLDDTNTLKRLVDPTFDPFGTVIVATNLASPSTVSTNQSPGTIANVSQSPKKIVLKVDASAPAILLVNQRYAPDWKAFVNGQPSPVLRCNYIMQGVQVSPGASTVEFRFEPSARSLYISLAAIAAALGLCGLLAVKAKSSPGSSNPASKGASPP